MKMVQHTSVLDSYQKNEMISKNSSMWFLNSHRFVTLEKILTAYISNFREFYQVLNKDEASQRIIFKTVLFQTKQEGFSNVLSFYYLLKLVCEYQNQIRLFEFGAHKRLTNFEYGKLKSLIDVIDNHEYYKSKLVNLRSCVIHEMQFIESKAVQIEGI